MIFDCRLIILVNCYSHGSSRRETAENNSSNFLRPENLENATNFQNSVNHPLLIHNLRGGIKTEFFPQYAYEYEPNFNVNSIQRSNLFHNLGEDDSCYDQNFMAMQCSQFNLNVTRQLFWYQSNFKTLKDQNNESVYQGFCANEERYENHHNYECDATSPLNIQNQIANSLIEDNRGINETGEKFFHNRSNAIPRANKKSLTRSCNFEYSEEQNNSQNSTFSDSLKFNNLSDEINQLDSNNSNQSLYFAEKSVERLQKILYGLNSLKTYEKRFLNYNRQDETFYSTLLSDLKELNEVTEYAKTVCRR